MAERTKSEKRFDRFFVIIIVVSLLTIVLTYSTTHIAKQKQLEDQLDSTSVTTKPNATH